jgi:hypothetical protein
LTDEELRRLIAEEIERRSRERDGQSTIGD